MLPLEFLSLMPQSHCSQPSSSTDPTVGTSCHRSLYMTTWNFCKTFHAAYSLWFPLLDVLTLFNFITFAHSILKIKFSTIQVSGIIFFVKLSWGMLMTGLRKAKPCPMPKRLLLTSDLLAHCITTPHTGYLSTHIDKVLESMFLHS